MQAMPDGGEITIKMKTRQESMWLAFEEQGDGVSAKAMEKIWDPFFTTKEKGTGLGLGIVKNIIEAHDGQIRIENRKERGARVVVRLPLQKEH
jgi:signal transduction histidine kinase